MLGSSQRRRHVEKRGGVGRGPKHSSRIGRRDRKSSFGFEGFYTLPEQDEGLFGGRDDGALEKSGHQGRVQPRPFRREAYVIVPALAQSQFGVGRLFRRLLAPEKLAEAFRQHGTEKSVGIAEMMVERGSGHVRRDAHRPGREARLAILFKEPDQATFEDFDQ